LGSGKKENTMVASTLPDRLRRHEPVRAGREDRADIAKLSSALHAAIDRAEPRCSLVGPRGENFAIPEAVFYILARVVEVLERGDAITLVPVGKELTTQQAADLLNVSRQYLVRLLDEGKIPYTRTGKHRRLRVEDVMTFKQTRDRERDERLNELTRLSEEFGGYEELKK
jgi:excisionase family DNA binding protein